MKRRLNETIEIGDEVYVPSDEYTGTVIEINGDEVLVDGPFGEEYHNLSDLEKLGGDYEYEMGESKGLFEARKKVIRLTESDLTRLVKQIIKESNGDELEELKNDIDDICEEYQDEVKQMVKRNGSLNLDEAKEILSDLKNNLEEFLEESSHDEMEDEDYFDLEEYAGDCVSNFISFLNEHTD